MRPLPPLARPHTFSGMSVPRRVFAVIAVVLGMLAAVLLPAPAASADVDDFSYSSWESRYELSLDDKGRAVAHVTETLVAEFPDFDQNKGIIRGYPQRYEGAGLSVEIVSVTDAEGRPVPFETETEDGELLVLTGDDDYVHGSNTYVIESTMRDVMIHGTETGNDEFYWNLLPLSSSQDIGRFRAEIVVSPELADALTGDVACYSGQAGASDACELSGPRAVDGGQAFTVESGARAAGDGVTVAIGFAAGTVTQPPSRLPDPVADYAPGIVGLGAIAVSSGAWASVVAFVRRRRRATGIVVAQFDVPADMPPVIAAALLPKAPNPMPAQMVHLAVQGAVRLEEGPGGDRPALRLLDASRAQHPLDRETLATLFRRDETVRRIPRSSTKFAKRMEKLVAAGRAEAAERGWTGRERSRAAAWFAWAAVGLLVVAVVLLGWSASKDRELLAPSFLVVLLAAIVVVLTAIVAFSRHRVLTRAGAERYEYLQGVAEFIRVAEADRLRMLQSYTGAERRSDGTVDVVHLYEKLLPYAMLLGEEKSWTAVLDTAYSASGGSPSWIDTAAGVSIGSNLARYSSSMNTATTYTPPSSSSGGSTGGGFSGGGGGGGSSGGR
ncbi:DUF2207 family protein [Microbacterium sp. YJN-G]|uniref:DUF2207 family protein n=1 Tax=Microbacterium sp. YJN-G TaxID=2763257 RepID=UPI001D0C1467|nr:DUF2207 domain-containing protein [Microbacterium sp. YJN-G]